MGISDRLKFIARTYLNSFLDSSTSRERSRPDVEFVDDDDFRRMSDEEFEARWEHFQEEQNRSGSSQRESYHEPPPPRKLSGERSIEQCYRNLECPVDADLKTVRSHFRRLIKRFHPDLHADNKRNQEAANRISQILTECYQQLETHLQSKGQR
jgi:DnaJ-domain-containing protein 1